MKKPTSRFPLMGRNGRQVPRGSLPEDAYLREAARSHRAHAATTVEEKASRHDAALKETFGTVPDLVVPSRDEWERG